MAPISPAYVWEETETSVIVTATCRGATSANTDAFSSPHYVSVNSPPFFLELDLHGRIDSIAASTAVRRGGQIELRLPKAQPGLWGRLLVELPKPERLRRRAESRAAAEALALEQVERKKKKQWDDSRFALNHQMTKDREDRDRIAELKKAEKAAPAAELARFQAESERGRVGGASQAPAAVRVPQQPRRARIEEVDITEESDAPPLLAPDAPLDKAIFTEEDAARGVGSPPERAPPPTALAAPPPPPPPPDLPPPRQSGAVTVKFTAKLLPAPARTKGGDVHHTALQPRASTQGPRRGLLLTCLRLALDTGRFGHAPRPGHEHAGGSAAPRLGRPQGRARYLAARSALAQGARRQVLPAP